MKGLVITDNNLEIKTFSGTDRSLIEASIERLLFLELGGIMGALTIGSRILDYFFELATAKNAQAIMEEVKFLVTNFEPRIILNAVGINLIPEQGTIGILILLNYSLVENPDKKYIVEYQKVRTI